MAQAYTPGLKVAAGRTIRNERRLPIEGEVTVQVGDRIEAEAVVAKAALPGNVQLVNITKFTEYPHRRYKGLHAQKRGRTDRKR